MPFHAKPGCPKHLVNVYKKAVNALPSSYLLPPVIGEVFTSIEACEQRLRGFALAEGFNIAHTGGGNQGVPGGRNSIKNYKANDGVTVVNAIIT
jgi:hypothetical protein